MVAQSRLNCSSPDGLSAFKVVASNIGIPVPLITALDFLVHCSHVDVAPSVPQGRIIWSSWKDLVDTVAALLTILF
jgi:hypothetical protein